MVFEAHCMSFPCTELLLFNYAKVNTVSPFYGTFKIVCFHQWCSQNFYLRGAS